jgi:hypothetical protein
MNNKFCFDNCEYLSITEKEQNKREYKEPHICKKYSKRVLHGCHLFHPHLLRLKECDYKFIKKEEI